MHGEVQLSGKKRRVRYPASHSSSISHPLDFARARTNADRLATHSAHPQARTHSRPTHPITHHDQRYTAAEQQQQQYVQKQGLSTLIHAFEKCSRRDFNYLNFPHYTEDQ